MVEMGKDSFVFGDRWEPVSLLFLIFLGRVGLFRGSDPKCSIFV